MKSQRHLFVSVMLAIITFVPLSAQTICDDFACIGEINLTLSDGCEGRLIPSMLLTGDTACINSLDFRIVVEDDSTANGPVIDGCGRFRYRIEPVDTTLTDFTGCWGFVSAEDKTPPVIDSIPAPPFFFCSEFDRTSLTTLDPDIPRCYRVNGDGSFAGYIPAPGRQPITDPGRFLTTQFGRLLTRTGGLPKVTDSCAPLVEVCIGDAETTTDDQGCADRSLRRTITVTGLGSCPSADEGAGAGASTYDILFVRPSLSDVSPDNIKPVVLYDCLDRGIEVDRIPDPLPGDFPFFLVDSNLLYLRNTNGGTDLCNFVATYEDGPLFRSCNATLQTIRTYTAFDWCNPDTVLTFTQVVKIGDTSPPLIEGPFQDRNFDNEPDEGPLRFTTNSVSGCGAFIRLDDPTLEITDNCSFGYTLLASVFPEGDTSAVAIGLFTVDPLDGDAEISGEIPVGRHLLRYDITDECGNRAIYDYDILVSDDTPPVAICEDGLNISLSGEGTALLLPEMIDLDSYDGCSDVTLTVAPVGADNLPTAAFTPTLSFGCDDLGVRRIGLRATDAGGRFNDCWLDILIEDKQRPECVPPSPLFLSCRSASEAIPANPETLSGAELDQLFGRSEASDNCPGEQLEQTLLGTLNDCGQGSYLRRFTVTDAQGFTNATACTQRITIFALHDYQLELPADLSGECREMPELTVPTSTERGCDLLAINLRADTFRSSITEECYKVEVTHEIINWCEYNGLGAAIDLPRQDGRRLYLSVSTGPDDRTLADDRARFGTNALGNNPDLLPDYGTSQRRGYFRYVQFLKVYDNVAPDIRILSDMEGCFPGTAADCSGSVTLSFIAADLCSQAATTADLDLDFDPGTGFRTTRNVSGSVVRVTSGIFSLALEGIPVGRHAIRLLANDGCGNVDTEIIPFCVAAARPVAPICIQQLTVTLMPDGEGGGSSALWATDVIASETEDCFGNVVDRYAIYRESEIAAGTEPTFPRPGIDFECGEDEVSVRVYAYAGDQTGFCVASVVIQDNGEACDGTLGRPAIAGRIASVDGVPIPLVSVGLTGPDDLARFTATSSDGNYGFAELPSGDYTVDPDHAVAIDLRVVKTSDIIAIQRHILGTRPLADAYGYIAADVNADGEIDIFDLIGIRRVILGVDGSFQGGDSWVFVPAEFQFNYDPAGGYLEIFPEVLNRNQLTGRVEDADFIGVERGNVVR